MNARSNTFEIKCAGHQINDVVSAIFHTILFYRTTGKVTYKDDISYSVGSLGYEDVQCDFIDYSYVRCASPSIINSLNSKIREFVEKLRDSREKVGTITIEFYKKKKSSGVMGFFTDSNLVWEIWNLKIICVDDRAKPEVLNLEEVILDKVISIIQIVNGARCITPQMPDRDNVDAFFDVSFDDAQPYLHRIHHRIGEGPNASTNLTNNDLGLKKLIKDALAL
ncbi:autophagy-related protein 101 [Tetranychus urticae]|uniref:Autophagy-related protein 101 n=1 Tax=Tetranychus urticae TaxID=32264 RepID=T1K5W4_TETUR|nr:autophagy-related protein 101 [Tetranychus urticae]